MSKARDAEEVLNPKRQTFTPSKRAATIWHRFCAWYGTDVIERKYDITCPEEWARVLDRLDREIAANVLCEMKSRHPTFPPTLMEFEAIVKEFREPAPSALDGPSVIERLTDYVLARRRLTPWQLSHSSQWRCEYQGHCGRAGMPASAEFATAAIVVPADPNGTPGFRVTVMDMEAGV